MFTYLFHILFSCILDFVSFVEYRVKQCTTDHILCSPVLDLLLIIYSDNKGSASENDDEDVCKGYNSGCKKMNREMWVPW